MPLIRQAQIQMQVKPDTIRLYVPTCFYDDHKSRDLPSGSLIRQDARGSLVELDRKAYDDLLSDAQYYCDMADQGAFEPGEITAVVKSARWTVRKLKNNPFPE